MLNSAQKLQTPNQSCQKLSYDNNYETDYMRLYIANVVLTQQLKELLQEKSEIIMKLLRFEKQSKQSSEPSIAEDESLEARRRRLRRTASEISRHYKCPVKSCQKSYGSEGSLTQHVKLKHENNNYDYQFDSSRKISKK